MKLLLYIVCSILLPSTINTPQGEEYGPTLTIDDNTLYFVGLNRSDANISEDIFVSRRDPKTGEWSAAQIVPGLSNPYRNEAPTSVSGDGKTMLLFVEGKMCFSQRSAYGWTEPRPLPAYLQLGNWQADAQLTADGSALLFAANYAAEAEQQPSLNIFVSERTQNGWGTPYSIGPAINTTGMERSPFLHPDMQTLYFASDRPGTLGELDIWVAHRLADTCWNCWSEPENLGPDINTTGRDCWYKISTDGTTAYYAQKAGKRHDIYAVTLPEDKRPQPITVLAANQAVSINHLLFETDKATILPESLPELKRIAAFVATYGYKIRLAGHTDDVGTPEHNQTLSQQRAEAVKQQLIDYGVPPENIKALGYGDRKPLVPNDSDSSRALNRRVEITLY